MPRKNWTLSDNGHLVSLLRLPQTQLSTVMLDYGVDVHKLGVK